MRVVAIMLAAIPLHANADDDRREYAPELNAYHNFSAGARLFLLADTSKVESEDAWQNQLGVHLDLSTKHTLREKLNLGDWARARTVGVRVGYRQSRAWDGEREDVSQRRVLLELTLRGSLPNGFAMAHRFGFDQRELTGESSQRYRYRLNLERELTAGRTVLAPYAEVELTYDSRYSAWSRQHYQLGSEIELTKQWRLEPYLALDKDTEPDIVYTHRIGLIAKFYW